MCAFCHFQVNGNKWMCEAHKATSENQESRSEKVCFLMLKGEHKFINSVWLRNWSWSRKWSGGGQGASVDHDVLSRPGSSWLMCNHVQMYLMLISQRLRWQRPASWLSAAWSGCSTQRNIQQRTVRLRTHTALWIQPLQQWRRVCLNYAWPSWMRVCHSLSVIGLCLRCVTLAARKLCLPSEQVR